MLDFKIVVFNFCEQSKYFQTSSANMLNVMKHFEFKFCKQINISFFLGKRYTKIRK